MCRLFKIGCMSLYGKSIQKELLADNLVNRISYAVTIQLLVPTEFVLLMGITNCYSTDSKYMQVLIHTHGILHRFMLVSQLKQQSQFCVHIWTILRNMVHFPIPSVPTREQRLTWWQMHIVNYIKSSIPMLHGMTTTGMVPQEPTNVSNHGGDIWVKVKL